MGHGHKRPTLRKHQAPTLVTLLFQEHLTCNTSLSCQMFSTQSSLTIQPLPVPSPFYSFIDIYFGFHKTHIVTVVQWFLEY